LRNAQTNKSDHPRDSARTAALCGFLAPDRDYPMSTPTADAMVEKWRRPAAPRSLRCLQRNARFGV
jgi:hypothetical protein